MFGAKRKRAALLSAFVFISACFAGCAGIDRPGSGDGQDLIGELTQPVYEILPAISEMIESFDGILLNVCTFLPSVAEGAKIPLIIDAGPYYGNSEPSADQIGTSSRGYWVDFFVPRGYAVAHASVRGTGFSGGSFDLGGIAEQRDVYEIVEAMAAKPWCNGKVALVGKSYDGTTPWEGAIMNPPHLTTIIPVAGISDMYRYMFYDGAAYVSGPFFNSYYTASEDWYVNSAPEDAQQLLNILGAVSPDVLDNIAEGYLTWADGNHDAFWDERDYSASADKINCSVLVIHGLQDWNVKPDNFAAIYSKIRSPKKIVLGQWEHIMHYEKSAINDFWRPDFNITINAWMDYWLLGKENGIMDEPAALVQDTSGEWHYESDWPHPAAETVKLNLDPGGALLECPSNEGSVSFSTIPGQSPEPGGDSSFQAAFVSEPLNAPVRISGVPELSLSIIVDRLSGHVSAALYDVDRNGTWNEINRAVIDLRHRNTRDEIELVAPGEISSFSFDMYPCEAAIEAGHSIGLIISGDNINWVLPDLNCPSFEVMCGGSSSFLSVALIRG